MYTVFISKLLLKQFKYTSIGPMKIKVLIAVVPLIHKRLGVPFTAGKRNVAILPRNWYFVGN